MIRMLPKSCRRLFPESQTFDRFGMVAEFSLTTKGKCWLYPMKGLIRFSRSLTYSKVAKMKSRAEPEEQGVS